MEDGSERFPGIDTWWSMDKIMLYTSNQKWYTDKFHFTSLIFKAKNGISLFGSKYICVKCDSDYIKKGFCYNLCGQATRAYAKLQCL